MIQYLLQAIPAAVQTAKGISDYFKKRKQQADTSAIDRFMNNVKSQSANNASYNIARSNLSRQVNTGLRTAQDNLTAQQTKTGIANTPFATRQNLQLEQGALDTLSQGASAIETQQMQQQDIAKQRLAEAQLQKDTMVQQFNQQKKQQQGELVGNIIQGAVGTAMSVIQGLQTSKQNKEMLSALSDEYKNRGLDESTIASVSSQYADNPQLAQRVLENKAITNEIAVKAPAVRQTIDYALSQEQRETLNSVANNPGLQLQLMQAYSNDPMVSGRLSAQQKMAYQDTLKPELLKQAKSFNITNAENLTFDQLQNNIDLQNTAMKTIESYTPEDKGKFTTLITSGKTPLQAVTQIDTDKEFAQFNNYASTYPDYVRNKPQVVNISRLVATGGMSATEGRTALEQLAQTYKPASPKQPNQKEEVATMEIADSISSINTNMSDVLTGTYFKYNDQSGNYQKMLRGINDGTVSNKEVDKAIVETQKRINRMNAFIKNPTVSDKSPKQGGIQNNKSSDLTKQVADAQNYVIGLTNILSSLKELKKSYRDKRLSIDPNDLFGELQ